MVPANAPPERPSLSPELFQRVRAIQIRTQHLVTEALAGEYESAFRGRGMEFDQLRAYQPGDDIRHIDWNVTARLGQPFVKSFHEERELTVLLAIDLSSSSAFGSGLRFRHEVAAEVAAILAYTAIRSHDRVGLVVFSDHIEHFIPPKKGRMHVWRVIREILAARPQRRGTDLAAALDFVGRVLHRRSVVFFVSDFFDEHYEDRLRVVARRHDFTAVVVRDARERILENSGLIALEDLERGGAYLVDTTSAQVRAAFATRVAQENSRRNEIFRRAGAGVLELDTQESYVEPIVRFFRARERHRGQRPSRGRA